LNKIRLLALENALAFVDIFQRIANNAFACEEK